MQDSGFKKKDTCTSVIPQEQTVYTRGGEPKVMKKVVNSVLASALALTVAPMVVGAEEAATQAPKMDANLEKVVKRLEALGLVAGYGNGDFGVDKTITRAEFATLIVRARNLEEGAKLAQYQSNFTDVKPADWFSGFVNVATGQEIVKGYADKTFKPQNQVTYAEAVTMIVRALGYEPATVGKGPWPNNFIAKASELNISKGIKEPGKAAVRGDIFQMLDNSLRVDLMKQVEYGTDIRFEEQKGKTLLTEYLDVTVRDMDWAGNANNKSEDLPFVVNVPVVGLGTLKANQIAFDGRNAGLGGSNSIYKVADGINPNEFAGQHVQVWVKDDREDVVVWMEPSEDEEVLNARMDTLYYSNKIVENGDKIKDKSDLSKLELKFDNDKTYRFDENVAVTFNFKRYGKGEGAAKGLKDIADAFANSYPLSAKIVLNEAGDISYIHVVDDVTLDKSVKGVKYGSEVIEKVDVDKKKITNLEDNSFDLKDKEEGKDFLVFINGQPAKLADLKPLDVYSVYYADGKEDKPLVFATRNVVEGNVADVEIRREGDNRLKIGDKTYRFRTGSSYSENANKDIKKIDSKNQDWIRNLDGEDVKVYLDAAGRIRHIETKQGIDDRKMLAVVTRQAIQNTSDDKYNFTVLTEKGKKLTVNLEDKDIKGLDGKKMDGSDIEDNFIPSIDEPVVVEVNLDSKGEVSKVQLVDTADLNALEGNAWDDAADKKDETVTDTINGKKQTFDVTSDTVVFDLTGKLEGSKRLELKDVGVGKFSAIADKDDVSVLYMVEDGDVKAIFVTDGEGAGSDTQYGYVKKINKANDTVTLIKKGDDGKLKEEDVKIDGDATDALDVFKRFDFISYTLNSDELDLDSVVVVVDGASDTPTDVAITDDLDGANLDDIKVGKVEKFQDSKITYTVGGDTTDYQLVNSSTLYLNRDFETSLDGVNEDDYVVMIDTDDDGTKLDYVLVVTDQDEVDENDYNMDDFLAQNGDTPTPPPADNSNFIENINAKRVSLMGAAYIYEVTVDLASGVADSDIDTVTLKLDGQEVTPDKTTRSGGKITLQVTSSVNAKSATIAVKGKNGKTDSETDTTITE